jgi:predicted ester cyclase
VSTQETIDRVQQFVTELNQGNLESIRHYIAADFFNYRPAADEPSATDTYYDLIVDIKAGLPDLNVTVEDLKSAGDILTGRLTVRGTKTGPLWGVPPTGKPVSWITSISIRPVNGRFAVNLDGLTVPELIGTLRQMDLVNPPEDMDKPPKYPVTVPDFILKVVFNAVIWLASK